MKLKLIANFNLIVNLVIWSALAGVFALTITAAAFGS